MEENKFIYKPRLGSKPLNVIRQRIEQYSMTDRPVSAVLILTFHVKVETNLTDTQKRSLRATLWVRLRDDFIRRLRQGGPVQRGQNQFIAVIPFEETGPMSKFMTCRSGYSDEIKAIVLKTIVSDLNHVWNQAIQGGQDESFQNVTYVNMNFLLAKPLEYLGLHPGNVSTVDNEDPEYEKQPYT